MSYFFSYHFYLFIYFWYAPVAYGGSQAIGQIRAVVAGHRARATATATQDRSCVCDLHHNSWQCWILNPLSNAGDWTCVLADDSQDSLTTEPWQELPISYHFLLNISLRILANAIRREKKSASRLERSKYNYLSS